jgi:hypothetical protein
MNSLKSLFPGPSHPRPQVTPERRRRLLLSYLPDWCVTSRRMIYHLPFFRQDHNNHIGVGLFSLSIKLFIVYSRKSAIFFTLDKVDGYRREFSLGDTSYVLCQTSRLLSTTILVYAIRKWLAFAITFSFLITFTSSYAEHERVPVTVISSPWLQAPH